MSKKTKPAVNPLPPNLQQLLDEYRAESRLIEAYHALDFRRTFMQNRWQDTPEQTPILVIHRQAPGRTVRQVCQKVATQAAQWMLEQGLAYLSARGTERAHMDKQEALFIDATYVVCDDGQVTNQETDENDRDHILHEKRDQRHPDRTAPGRSAHDPHDNPRHAGNQQPPSLGTANRAASGGPSPADDQ